MNKLVEIITFKLSKRDVEKINKWKESLSPIEIDVYGSDYQFEYIFYPTGLGITKKVRRVDGKELDLTDYDNW